MIKVSKKEINAKAICRKDFYFHVLLIFYFRKVFNVWIEMEHKRFLCIYTPKPSWKLKCIINLHIGLKWMKILKSRNKNRGSKFSYDQLIFRFLSLPVTTTNNQPSNIRKPELQRRSLKILEEPSVKSLL